MVTRAKTSFEDNWATVEALLAVGKDGGGRSQDQIAAVNQAAMVFMITAWEAYVEDVTREATGYMASNAPRFGDLPKSVQKSVYEAVTPINGLHSKSRSGKYPKDLADNGWRDLLRDLVIEATDGSSFNTPSSSNVKDMLKKWCGVDVDALWSWQNFEAPKPALRLDEAISLRGSIVHTGSKPDGINKNWIVTYGTKNIRKLVDRTDAGLIQAVNQVCGTTSSKTPFGVS